MASIIVSVPHEFSDRILVNPMRCYSHFGRPCGEAISACVEPILKQEEKKK